MLVRLAFVALMDMVMGAMFPGMGMVMGILHRAVLVGMLVFMGMLVGMDVGMLVAMLAYPGMFMLVLVFVGMLMVMVMVVFMVAFHGSLLFPYREPFLDPCPDSKFIFLIAQTAFDPFTCQFSRIRKNGA